ncbi:MBL fold metallo-hydrolase [Streptomyces sp. NPDC006602]|uniref:MBL fold metallo-hydrolase n=1 Tax=Streptomyces sp. NPDC006602 TaxID=3364751 RepID=UPI00368AC90D
MRLTVLGGCGAWPTATQACSGYLVEYAGFRLLVDPGYATFPRLLLHTTADAVDAVLVSHGHPDHCADLNPLLRARGLSDSPPPALPVFAPHGAVDAVLALDKPTGDTGPSDDIPRLAEGADLFLSEATYVHRVPSATDAPYLLTARLAGRYARQAGIARLLLTHLWPGTDPSEAVKAAAEAFVRPVGVATADLVIGL